MKRNIKKIRKIRNYKKNQSCHNLKIIKHDRQKKIKKCRKLGPTIDIGIQQYPEIRNCDKSQNIRSLET